MNCDEIQRTDARGSGWVRRTHGGRKQASGKLRRVCAEKLKAMRATMALLDEWQVPEPSPYFDVRLQARLREEMAKAAGGLAAVVPASGAGGGADGDHGSRSWAVLCTGGITQSTGSRLPMLDTGPGTCGRAICRRWKRITTCIPISRRWMIWICSRMSQRTRNRDSRIG